MIACDDLKYKEVFMGWRNVIVTQYSKLAYSGGMMTVQIPEKMTQIPVSDINLLLIATTQATLTTALISELAASNVKIIFTDSQHNPITETMNYYANNCNYQRLLNQFNWDVNRKQKLWTKIVNQKMNNQAAVLTTYHLSTETVRSQIDQLEFNDLTNREAVVAKKYFEILFGNSFSRRDPANILNAALNYGYSIILSVFSRQIVVDGYQTYLGVHHASTQNQFNLASDLMEPFRPFVDYWLYANRKITAFTPDIKFGLVELLSLEIKYKNKRMLLSTAIELYCRTCLDYLDGRVDEIEGVMELVSEVPNYAINDNV